jgi:photosystem II stability/assembly factor-like uncharacterized protein
VRAQQTDSRFVAPQNAGSVYEITDLAFVDAQIGVAVGSKGNLQRTEDGGKTWMIALNGQSSANFWTLHSLMLSMVLPLAESLARA